MQIFAGILFLTLGFLLYFKSANGAGAESIPRNSVQIRLEGGTTYRKRIMLLTEGKFSKGRPAWFNPHKNSWPRLIHDVYIITKQKSYYATVSGLKLHEPGPNHKATDKPQVAYIHLEDPIFLSAANFKVLEHETTDFDLEGHIFVALPQGPIYAAVIQDRSLPIMFEEDPNENTNKKTIKCP